MVTVSPDAYNRAASLLGENPEYRVLRKLRPVAGFHRPVPGARSRIGVAIDVETSGLDYESERIIELALQRFRYDDAGRIVQVGQARVWREDPGVPLDPRITKLTGLTDEILAGQAIGDTVALEILSSADLIVAHQPAYGRRSGG